MKVITISNMFFNPISLPGMGRSVEVPELPEHEMLEVRAAFAQQELYVEFTETPGERLKVRQMWANPHSTQVTLFV